MPQRIRRVRPGARCCRVASATSFEKVTSNNCGGLSTATICITGDSRVSHHRSEWSGTSVSGGRSGRTVRAPRAASFLTPEGSWLAGLQMAGIPWPGGRLELSVRPDPPRCAPPAAA